MPISPGAYSVLVSEIPLGTANGTVDAARNPQDADKSFQFPSDKDTTGVVTLRLGTTATAITVDIKVLDKSKQNVWMKSAFLQTAIRTALLDPSVGGSITWDIGHVTSKVAGSNSLSPKSFQFATYSKKDDLTSESILSLFIQTDTSRHGTVGEQLQANWLTQWWTTYGVPPIPESYTASVIFNSDMLIGLMTKSTGMTFVRSSDEESGLKLTVKTGETFYVEKEDHESGTVWNRHSEIKVNLDEEGKALRIAFDQKVRRLHYSFLISDIDKEQKDTVPSIILNWDFTASMTWGTHWYKDSYWQNGTATITNKLKKQQNMDSSKLSEYEVHMDVGVSAGDWDTPKIVNDESSGWANFWSTFDPNIVSGALPSALPSPQFKLLDFKFFVLTNLLLPGSKVIEFAKDGPGFRFPRDLYVVGQVVVK